MALAPLLRSLVPTVFNWRQEAIIEDPLPKLVNSIRRAYAINPNLDFEVFIHKVR